MENDKIIEEYIETRGDTTIIITVIRKVRAALLGLPGPEKRVKKTRPERPTWDGSPQQRADVGAAQERRRPPVSKEDFEVDNDNTWEQTWAAMCFISVVGFALLVVAFCLFMIFARSPMGSEIIAAMGF